VCILISYYDSRPLPPQGEGGGGGGLSLKICCKSMHINLLNIITPSELYQSLLV